ncbi:monocarboxylate permease [Grosmannia clavigera kw1407]|uniref:Monocarboxylate permease n=1 Tax=Grosmannia clavigera (strain kw1407 / UAMH 11150) TaxID=655863 RepID=F0XCS0_GROCL|nr:monocarboxylate permease [Grosmannia clavigera kw1407]EFX03978.1 monocarboxylate permease [Grosmannia clavigera kw1407]
MATITTRTGVELEDQSTAAGRTGVMQRDVGTSSGSDRRSTRGGANEDDPVLEASRLADATVPEGGYGWVAIAGCAVITWCHSGFCRVAANGSHTSALAIVNARIVRWLGIRRTGLLGVSLLGLGEIVSGSAVHSLAGLFVTAGIVMGLGISLCFTTVSVTPAQYFSRRRGLANDIVFAGGGLGGAATTYLLQVLVQKHGPAWAYRIVGFLTLATGLPAAWVVKERTPIRTTGFVDWRLFRDPKFLLIFLTGVIATFPLLVPPFFLPLYSRSIGLSSSTGAALLAGYNFASAVGRILCGFFCDRLGPVNTLFCALLLTALSMLALWPASTTLGSLAVFVVINGAANGGYFATMPTVVGNVFGSQRVAVAMGMVVTGWVGGYLMIRILGTVCFSSSLTLFQGAPIAGYLLQAYGGADSGLKAFRPAMFYAGSLSLGAAISVALMRLYISRSPFRKL